jgi:hypothetical protein
MPGTQSTSLSWIPPKTYREIPEMAGGPAVLGFLPAFQHLDTGEIHLSVEEDGGLAAVHLLDGLPDHWVDERDVEGRIIALKAGIIAGYMRQGCFYTRAQLSRLRWDG